MDLDCVYIWTLHVHLVIVDAYSKWL